MNKGYTLVEAIVAMGIFVLIAVLGTGIFTSILSAQRRTIQQQGTAQELRFFQDVVSRDIREAKTIQCNDPDPTHDERASSFTLSKTGDINSYPIIYNFDAAQTRPEINKTEGGVPSPLTDISISAFEVFCREIGSNRSFVTITILAEGSPFPYELSVTPRAGVIK